MHIPWYFRIVLDKGTIVTFWSCNSEQFILCCWAQLQLLCQRVTKHQAEIDVLTSFSCAFKYIWHHGRNVMTAWAQQKKTFILKVLHYAHVQLHTFILGVCCTVFTCLMYKQHIFLIQSVAAAPLIYLLCLSSCLFKAPLMKPPVCSNWSALTPPTIILLRNQGRKWLYILISPFDCSFQNGFKMWVVRISQRIDCFYTS